MLPPSTLNGDTPVVGEGRFELPASCSQSRRAAKLRHSPAAPVYAVAVEASELDARNVPATSGLDDLSYTSSTVPSSESVHRARSFDPARSVEPDGFARRTKKISGAAEPRPVARVAVFDLGSSSFHVLVADVTDSGDIRAVARDREMLHLGAVVSRTGRVPKAELRRAIEVVRRLRAVVDGVGADRVIGLATAALRDASNGGEVVDELSRWAGVPIRLLDGEAEARVVFAGQLAGASRMGLNWPDDGQDSFLGIDLGGGSLELAVGGPGGVIWATSADVGVARVHGALNLSDPLGAKGRYKVAEYTSGALDAAGGGILGHSYLAVLASGGTSRALARLVRAAEIPGQAGIGQSDLDGDEEAGTHGMVMSAAKLGDLAAMLARSTESQRLAMPGVQARRAALLPIGAAIIAEVTRRLGVSSLVVSDWGLREGAILDELDLSRVVKLGSKL